MLAFRQAFEPGDGAWLPPAELDHGPVVASWACGQNGPRAQIPVFTQASTIRVQLPTGCPPGLLPDPSGPGGPRQSRHLHLNWLSLLGPHLRGQASYRPPAAHSGVQISAPLLPLPSPLRSKRSGLTGDAISKPLRPLLLLHQSEPLSPPACPCLLPGLLASTLTPS